MFLTAPGDNARCCARTHCCGIAGSCVAAKHWRRNDTGSCGLLADGATTEWPLGTRAGTSRMAVVITADVDLVATDFGRASPDGVWLGITLEANELLPLK